MTIRVGDEFFEIPVGLRKLIRCAACGYRMIEQRQEFERQQAALAEQEAAAEREAIQHGDDRDDATGPIVGGDTGVGEPER